MAKTKTSKQTDLTTISVSKDRAEKLRAFAGSKKQWAANNEVIDAGLEKLQPTKKQ